MTPRQELKIKLPSAPDRLVYRAFVILKSRIEERCAARVDIVDGAADILLETGTDLAPEAFRIESAGAGVRIRGGSARGVIYGIGKFLRTSGYTGGFTASAWRGESMPQGTLRGVNFATHFHNWYCEAPEAEIVHYVEDMALWGVNAVLVTFPFINLNSWDDPQTAEALAMVRRYARIVSEVGLMFGIGAGNTYFNGIPQSIRAVPLADPTGQRGNSGNPVCPSQPEGHAYIMETMQQLFERLADLHVDFLVHWPYDEGGCACAECSPWGSHGFLRLSRELTRLGQKTFPGLKSVLSTWMFDTPPEGEWQGLSAALAADPSGVDYILADSHDDFPRYPLDVEVPGNLPLLNFPEISMWGNWPWGGVGANPLPQRFQDLWNQAKAKVRGGFPYSEGIYEDMNKAIEVQFYWDAARTARQTLEEYIAYEFGTPAVTADVMDLLGLFEMAAANSYRKLPVDAAGVRRAYDLAERIDARLPGWAQTGWRWEILHLRALLDRERFTGDGLETPAAEAALLRLIEIYHCQMETADPYHHRVRPPLRRATSTNGEL